MICGFFFRHLCTVRVPKVGRYKDESPHLGPSVRVCVCVCVCLREKCREEGQGRGGEGEERGGERIGGGGRQGEA